MEKLQDIATLRKIWPKVFYRRIQVASNYDRYVAHIDLSYAYLFNHIRIKYPDRVVDKTAAAVWLPGNAYGLGNVVRFTPAYEATHPNSLMAVCTVAGLSGVAEPAWGYEVGALIVDNLATWQIFNPYDTATSIPNTFCHQARIDVEILDHANDRLRTDFPVFVDNISMPGGNNSQVFAATQPATVFGYNVNFASNPIYRSPELNYLLRYGDAIIINFSGIRQVGALWVPNYIDIMIHGYYLPESTSPIHER